MVWLCPTRVRELRAGRISGRLSEPDSAATPAAGAGYVRKSLTAIGSNYVWGWESNRIAREVVEGSGGTVVGENICT